MEIMHDLPQRGLLFVSVQALWPVKSCCCGDPDRADLTFGWWIRGVLCDSLEVREEKETEGAQYHVKERRYGSFTRSIALPAAVVADKADAQFENGILTLELPKAEEVKPKTITVKAK